MNLEKLIELIFKNPDNISIEYSNINGKEKFIVNGEDITEYDDSQVKEEIANYKDKLKKLSDDIFEKVIDEAENHHFNLLEMNKGLELEHYTEDNATYARNVISLMTDTIKTVITKEIDNLTDTLEQW